MEGTSDARLRALSLPKQEPAERNCRTTDPRRNPPPSGGGGRQKNSQDDRAELESIRASLAETEQKLAGHRAAEQEIAAAEQANWALGWSGKGEAPAKPRREDDPWDL